MKKMSSFRYLNKRVDGVIEIFNNGHVYYFKPSDVILVDIHYLDKNNKINCDLVLKYGVKIEGLLFNESDLNNFMFLIFKKKEIKTENLIDMDFNEEEKKK